MDNTADLLSPPIVDSIFSTSPQVSLIEEELKGMLEMLDSAEPQQCQQQQQQQQPQFQQQQQYSPQVTLQQQQLAQQVVTQAGPVPTSFQAGFDRGQVSGWCGCIEDMHPCMQSCMHAHTHTHMCTPLQYTHP